MFLRRVERYSCSDLTMLCFHSVASEYQALQVVYSVRKYLGRSVELPTIYFAAIIAKSTCLRDNKTIELV